jgi:hypothetical protein
MKETIVLILILYGLLAAGAFLAGPPSEAETKGFKVVERWPWENTK